MQQSMHVQFKGTYQLLISVNLSLNVLIWMTLISTTAVQNQCPIVIRAY